MTLHTFHVGGCELQLLKLCKALREHPLQLMIVYSYVATSEKKITVDGVMCYCVPWVIQKCRLTHFYLAYLFRWKVKRLPQVFHCHAVSPFTEQVLGFAQKKNIPALVKVANGGHIEQLKQKCSERDSVWAWLKQIVKKEPFHVKKSRLENALFGRWRYSTYANASGYLSINPSIFGELERFPIQKKRIFPIPNGVDTDRFRPIDQKRKIALKQELGLPIDREWIVAIGRLVERKRFEDLILAWSAIEADYPDRSLLFIGDGPERAPLERLAQRLRIDARVRFEGMQNGLERYYQIAHLFVFPSRLEGLPNVVLEAMSSACPIVASHIPGICEVLESEKEGILFPPMDIAALKEAMRRMLDHPDQAARFGLAARQKALDCYSFQKIAPQFAGLYKKFIGERINCN